MDIISHHYNKRFFYVLSLVLYCWLGYLFVSKQILADVIYTGDLGLESTYFFESGEFGQDRSNVSVRVAPTFSWYPETQAWPLFNPDGLFSEVNTEIVFSPYYRWDSMDSARTHFDLREAYIGLSGDYSELVIGVAKEFWGKMEFANLVDIINQRDTIDDVTGQEKLGQPMVKWTKLLNSSEFSIYVLVGYRELAFPGEQGRFRAPYIVDGARSQVESAGSMRNKIDFAGRWSQSLGADAAWGELSISYFQGASRQPGFGLDVLTDGRILVFPIYPQIKQWGLEWEWLYDGWAVKIEGIKVVDNQLGHWSSALGLEYTWGNILGSGHDITGIFEYIYNDWSSIGSNFTEDDIALGLRWSKNDVLSTELLAGVLFDIREGEQLLSFEYSFRWHDSFEWTFSAQKALSKPLPPLVRIDSTEAFVEALNRLALSREQIERFSTQAGDLITQINSGDSNPGISFDNEIFVNSLSQLLRFAPSVWENKLTIYERDAFFRAELRYFW